jgi:hypothetical protein
MQIKTARHRFFFRCGRVGSALWFTQLAYFPNRLFSRRRSGMLSAWSRKVRYFSSKGGGRGGVFYFTMPQRKHPKKQSQQQV